jgi:DNA-binding beta-propeller fold protein YncE
MKKYVLFMMIGLGILAGCHPKTFTPIPLEMKTLISVNIKDGSLTFFDLENNKVFTEWKMEQPIKGASLLPDGKTLLLYGNELETVQLYNLAEGTLKEEWKTGKGIVNAIVSNDGKHIFFADQYKNAVRIFSTTGKELGTVKVGKKPLTLLQNNSGTRIYTVHFDERFLSVIDVPKKQVIEKINIPKSSTGGLIREEQKQLWIGGHGSGKEIQSNIHIYSLETGKLLDTIRAPEMPIYFIETKNGIFALSHGTSMIRKYNEHLQETGSLQVGSNPFAMAAGEQELYIASYDSNEIYKVDQQHLKIIEKFPSGNGPFQLIIREGHSLE